MQEIIPNSEVEALQTKIRSLLTLSRKLSSDTIDNTRVIVIHPEYWEVSLLVPYKNTKASEIKKLVEDILYKECDVDRQCCDYFGKQTDKQAYEWYFRHPKTPQDIKEKIEMEIEVEEGLELSMTIPIPTKNPPKSDMAFLAIEDEYFDQIANGQKKMEYRALNQYYCDKFFAGAKMKRLVKFNKGYRSGSENQMTFEIKDIYFVNSNYETCPIYGNDGKMIREENQLPIGFVPIMYGIALGKRVV